LKQPNNEKRAMPNSSKIVVYPLLPTIQFSNWVANDIEGSEQAINTTWKAAEKGKKEKAIFRS